MSDQFVTYEVENRIAVVTINNPPMNALSKAVFEQTGKVFDEIEKDDGIKAVVCVGEGRAFIAGADIKMLQTLKSAKEARELVALFHQSLNKIEALNKPVIAAIHGFCLGGGLEFALACHMRIAGEKAQFGVPEIKLGIFPGAGGTQRLPRVVGQAKALEMILTGQFISAQEALSWGLVNRVVEQDQVKEEAMKLASEILTMGQLAVQKAMLVVKEGLKGSLMDGLDIEADHFSELCESEDMREGMKAFLEKRPANFKDK